MPTSLVPTASPPACPATAIAAGGCLLGATLAIGIAAIAAPRTHVRPPIEPVAVRIDARILAADGSVVSAPSLITFEGDHSEYSVDGGVERLGLRVTPAKHHGFIVEIDHHHLRDHATARVRVREGQRASVRGADGMTVEVAPRIVHR